jgi:hypothetical protein
LIAIFYRVSSGEMFSFSILFLTISFGSQQLN